MKPLISSLLLVFSSFLINPEIRAESNNLAICDIAENPGDANCDETSNLLDVITIVNYVLGFNPQPFCFENADVNNDGIINSIDVIGTLNLIISGGTFTCGLSITYDIEGNPYNTLQLGNQCWMKENLRTTMYRNGTPVEYPGNSNLAWQSNTNGAYAWYFNDSTWKEVYGALYNWFAANNTDGLCPSGWHVPSNSEWYQLYFYVGSQGFYSGNDLKTCRQENSPLGGDCNTVEHPRWNAHEMHYGTDAVGFSWLPGGIRQVSGYFGGIGFYGYFWTSNDAYTQYMFYNQGQSYMHYFQKQNGFSVRCLKDNVRTEVD